MSCCFCAAPKIVADELQTALASEGVICDLVANPSQLLEALDQIEYDFRRMDRSMTRELQANPAVVSGSVARWGTEAYVIRLQVFDFEVGRVIGGSSVYVDRRSIPQEMARDAFGMQNLPEDAAGVGSLAAYEKRAICGTYGYFPIGDGVRYLGGSYENKISRLSALSISVGKINYEDSEPDGYWAKGDGWLYSLSIRSYPFYKGRGLRGFFFGAGLGIANVEYEERDWEWWGDREVLVYERDDTSAVMLAVDAGNKILLGSAFFVEPSFRLVMIMLEDDDPMVAGYLGVSAGLLW